MAATGHYSVPSPYTQKTKKKFPTGAISLLHTFGKCCARNILQILNYYR